MLKNAYFHCFRGFWGTLKTANFYLQTSVMGLNRSEFKQESSQGIQFDLRLLLGPQNEDFPFLHFLPL